jgi:transposase
MHAAPDVDGCSDCGGTMGKLGEDVTEVLEYVPGRFRVVRHVRPKLSCNRCDAISQAPAPALPVPRGRAGPGLLAHVIVSKFADHLPLYRQSQIYAREGVEISRSTMADWLGQASWLLQPLVDRIADHVMASVKLHADDTPSRCWRRGPGRQQPGGYGCICAITDDGATWTSRQRCSATAPIARASDRASISRPLWASCRPMPMPVSSVSTRVTASRTDHAGCVLGPCPA